MKLSFFYILFCFWASSAMVVNAQVIPSSGGTSVLPKVYTNSPEAASLGSYTEQKINMFTGQPDINIGLYTLSVGDYKMPISLTYNLAGVKPDEHPGMMGLGWSLVAGGVITRNVKGGADEYLSSSSGGTYSYYDHYSTLDRSDWSSSAFLQELTSKMRTYAPVGSGALAYPAPDEFNFSVNGMSGSFYKNHKGLWVLASGNNMNLKISDILTEDYTINMNEFISPSGERTLAKSFTIKRIIYGFTITDENGMKYIFGSQPNSIDFSAQADP
ncbi:MAG: hypothetical protein J7497_09640, partial [Chitinophagaceae bacterium]|nr:hypothetical protein [Chitinophagaceae bacterium]